LSWNSRLTASQEAEVQADPYTRAHQNKLILLKQEIEAIQHTVNSQLGAVFALQQAIFRRQASSNRIFPGGDPPRGDLPVVDKCVYHIQNRVADFKEIKKHAYELERWNLSKIESNKDRHDNAIYAFTIVTVIFLPLSFITGYLGMNTSDINNMAQGQWVFWAAAVPFTTIIVLVTALGAGELGNASDSTKRYIRKLIPNRLWRGGYTRLMETMPDVQSHDTTYAPPRASTAVATTSTGLPARHRPARHANQHMVVDHASPLPEPSPPRFMPPMPPMGAFPPQPRPPSVRRTYTRTRILQPMHNPSHPSPSPLIRSKQYLSDSLRSRSPRPLPQRRTYLRERVAVKPSRRRMSTVDTETDSSVV